MRRWCLLGACLVAFFGPGLAGRSEPELDPQLVDALMARFPGLQGLGQQGQGQQPRLLTSLGYQTSGPQFYQGQGSSSFNLSPFESVSGVSPESVTAGLAQGSYGKSASQTPVGAGQQSPLLSLPSLQLPMAQVSATQGGWGGGDMIGAPASEGTTGNSDVLGSVGNILGGASQALNLFQGDNLGTQTTTPGYSTQRAGERTDYTWATGSPSGIPQVIGPASAASTDVGQAVGAQPSIAGPSIFSAGSPDYLKALEGTGSETMSAPGGANAQQILGEPAPGETNWLGTASGALNTLSGAANVISGATTGNPQQILSGTGSALSGLSTLFPQQTEAISSSLGLSSDSVGTLLSLIPTLTKLAQTGDQAGGGLGGILSLQEQRLLSPVISSALTDMFGGSTLGSVLGSTISQTISDTLGTALGPSLGSTISTAINDVGLGTVLGILNLATAPIAEAAGASPRDTAIAQAAISITASLLAGSVTSAAAAGAQLATALDAITAAEKLQTRVENIYGQLPGELTTLQGIPGISDQLNTSSTPEDAARILKQLNDLQNQFQTGGWESYMKQGATTVGGGSLASDITASLPDVRDVLAQQSGAVFPAMDVTRLRAEDLLMKAGWTPEQIQQQTGRYMSPADWALQLGGRLYNPSEAGAGGYSSVQYNPYLAENYGRGQEQLAMQTESQNYLATHPEDPLGLNYASWQAQQVNSPGQAWAAHQGYLGDTAGPAWSPQAMADFAAIQPGQYETGIASLFNAANARAAGRAPSDQGGPFTIPNQALFGALGQGLPAPQGPDPVTQALMNYQQQLAQLQGQAPQLLSAAQTSLQGAPVASVTGGGGAGSGGNSGIDLYALLKQLGYVA